MRLCAAATALGQARLAASHGDSAGAAAAWAAAIDAYSRALLRPEALGDLVQRSDVRYNLACRLVGAGRLGEAAVLVKELVRSGSVDAAEVQTDAELAPILGML